MVYTFVVDDRRFRLLDATMDGLTGSLFHSYVTGRDSSELVTLMDNGVVYLDVDPESFGILVRLIRGYQIPIFELPPTMLKMVYHDAKRLDLLHILPDLAIKPDVNDEDVVMESPPEEKNSDDHEIFVFEESKQLSPIAELPEKLEDLLASDSNEEQLAFNFDEL